MSTIDSLSEISKSINIRHAKEDVERSLEEIKDIVTYLFNFNARNFMWIDVLGLTEENEDSLHEDLKTIDDEIYSYAKQLEEALTNFDNAFYRLKEEITND